jgi:hypothetical protein
MGDADRRAECGGAADPQKAMPVMLTTPEEWVAWLSVPLEEALKLHSRCPLRCSRW